jgi:hypothetical protein
MENAPSRTKEYHVQIKLDLKDRTFLPNIRGDLRYPKRDYPVCQGRLFLAKMEMMALFWIYTGGHQ